MKRLLILLILGSLFTGGVSASPPERIASLAPSITETLYALDLEDRIVAVTNFCDHPPRAKEKPKIGGMSNPSLEAIVSIKPDIVVITMDGNPKGIDLRLKQLGIRTYVFAATQIAELPQAIRDLGDALEAQEQAEDLASRIEISLSQYSVKSKIKHNEKFPERPRGKAIFIIWPEPLVVAGKGTAVDDVLNLLGWENIASDSASRYPKYSVEAIINQSPDVIFIGKMRGDIRKLSKGILKKLSMLEAVRGGRVYFTTDALYRLGPRVIQGMEELAGYLIGE